MTLRGSCASAEDCGYILGCCSSNLLSILQSSQVHSTHLGIIGLSSTTTTTTTTRRAATRACKWCVRARGRQQLFAPILALLLRVAVIIITYTYCSKVSITAFRSTRLGGATFGDELSRGPLPLRAKSIRRFSRCALCTCMCIPTYTCVGRRRHCTVPSYIHARGRLVVDGAVNNAYLQRRSVVSRIIPTHSRYNDPPSSIEAFKVSRLLFSIILGAVAAAYKGEA